MINQVTLAFRLPSLLCEIRELYLIQSKYSANTCFRLLAATACQAGVVALIILEMAILTKSTSKNTLFKGTLGQLFFSMGSQILAPDKTDKTKEESASKRFIKKYAINISKFYSINMSYFLRKEERFLGLTSSHLELLGRAFTALEIKLYLCSRRA